MYGNQSLKDYQTFFEPSKIIYKITFKQWLICNDKSEKFKDLNSSKGVKTWVKYKRVYGRNLSKSW